MGRFVSYFILISLLNACTFGVPIGETNDPYSNTSSSNIPSSSTQKNKSYIVFGQRYTILNSSEGYVKRGVASWYGKKFHGRKTSNGEIYDMFAMTAAHKSLPLPTKVSVKNLSNGKTIIVRVNDRGPFVNERIIDLSYAAAKKLGIIAKGTAQVEIRAVGRNNSTPAVRIIPLKDIDQLSTDTFIQVGSFSLQDNALSVVTKIKDLAITDVNIYPIKNNNGTFYRVRVGPYSDLDHAKLVLQKLRRQQFKQARLVIEN